MAGYIGANTSSVTNNQNAAERRKKFTFTAATTSLTGLNFLPEKIHIFHNGIRLVRNTDYTEASDGKSVTLTNAAQAGDEVVAVTFAQAPTTDVVPASTGGTFSGDVVASTRLQVGDSSITQQYPTMGYVADFQASTGSQTFISIAEPSASSLGNNGVIIGEDASDTYITQRGNKNIKLATQDLNRLIIDGSGRVTMPYQPAFGVYKTATTASGGAVTHNGSWANIGSHYDSSNGRFTAPVAGQYYFYCTGLTQPSGNVSRMSIFVNGANRASQSRNENLSGDYLHIVTVGVMTLAANDYVQMYYANDDGSTTLYSDTSPYITFGGYLIG